MWVLGEVCPISSCMEFSISHWDLTRSCRVSEVQLSGKPLKETQNATEKKGQQQCLGCASLWAALEQSPVQSSEMCPYFRCHLYLIVLNPPFHAFPSFPFAADTPVGTFLVALYGLARHGQLQMDFGFPNLTPTHLGSVLTFLQVTCPCWHTSRMLPFSISILSVSCDFCSSGWTALKHRGGNP